MLIGNKLPSVLLILCFFSLPSLAASVEVTGYGAIIDANLADARKNALEDAKRVAVEQMLGSYISARTETQNFMLASEKIYSTAKGQLDGYEILEEGKIDQDTFKVKINARIDDQAMVSEANLQLTKFKWYKQPKVAIQTVDSSGEHATVINALFVSELSNNLKKAGFSIVSAAKKTTSKPTFIILSSLSTNTTSNQYQGIEVKSNQLAISTNLQNAQSGQVLSTSAESADAAGANSLSQYKKMVSKLAIRIAQRVNLDTKTIWISDSSQSITLNMETRSEQEFAAIDAALKNLVVGLSALEIQRKQGNITTYLAQYQGWPAQLYEQLSSLSLDAAIPFTVTLFNGSELTISAKN